MIYIDKKRRQSSDLPDKVMHQVNATLNGAGFDSVDAFAKGDAIVIVAHDLPGFDAAAVTASHPNYTFVYPIIVHTAHYDLIRIPTGARVHLGVDNLTISV